MPEPIYGVKGPTAFTVQMLYRFETADGQCRKGRQPMLLAWLSSLQEQKICLQEMRCALPLQVTWLPLRLGMVRLMP